MKNMKNETDLFAEKLERMGYEILIKTDNELVVKEPDGTTKILTKN